MRWTFLLFFLAGPVLSTGCLLFGDRPCEPGRYACPSAEPGPSDLGSLGACTLERPCPLPPPQVQSIDSASAGAAADLVSMSGLGDDVWLVGTNPADQGVLLHAVRGQKVLTAAVLPTSDPRSLTAIPTADPPLLLIASQGSAYYEYAPLSGQVTTRPLDTGSCQGRISAAGAVSGALALAAEDLWLVGAPTSDAAAGLFRIRRGACQVLSEPASTGLSFSGVWGTLRSPTEPAQRLVWAVGDSGAAVAWTFQGPDGSPLAQHFRIPSGGAVRAVSGSTRCPMTPTVGDGTGLCIFMITGEALYSASDHAPVQLPLPASLRQAELTGVFVDGESVWLYGAQAAAGFVARYRLSSAAWSYLGGLPPQGGALRAAWGAGDGSLWLAGDRGTILYLPNGS